jgi:hypothetical protein
LHREVNRYAPRSLGLRTLAGEDLPIEPIAIGSVGIVPDAALVAQRIIFAAATDTPAAVLKAAMGISWRNEHRSKER